MPIYKEHYVAFLDILGFKTLLKTTSCEEIYSIFEVLHKKTHAKLNQNGVEIQAFNHIKHTILSNSIIVYIESDIEDAFAALIHVCKQLQFSLANRGKPILLRGGIAIGDLFYENDIIYGNGLASAYLLENNLAKYPRIVFSGDTLDKGLQNTKYMFVDMEGIIRPYKEDDDALFYIDYLFPDFCNTNELIKYFDALIKECNFFLNQAIDQNLREKYIWLKSKIEKARRVNSSVAKHYDKMDAEKHEKWLDEYNSRFSIYQQQLQVEAHIEKE